MVLNAAQKFCAGFLGILIFYWACLFFTHSQGGFYNYLYSFLFGLIPLLGGVYCIVHSDVWGGTKSAVGRAIFFTGVGIFCWGIGSVIWAYYNFFLGVAAPYPSLADLYYAPSIFFYGMGIIFLSQALGTKYAFRSLQAKILTCCGILFVTVLSYYLLIVVARNGILITPGDTFLKTILDVAYPLGDFLGLSIAVLVSGLTFRYLGGAYKVSVLSLLAGLAVMFIGDSVFSYTTTVGTYYNGDIGDLILTLGVFLLTFGALGLTKIQSLQRSPFFYYPSGPGSYEQIALRIIKEQERMLGPVAWREAKKVPGLLILDQDKGEIVIEQPNKKMVVDVLASQYENFFGRAAREISTEAIEQPPMRFIQKKLLQFSEERGWLENAVPASYAKSISIESAELLELFQWNSPTAEELLNDPEKLLKVQRELADVFIYGINLANMLNLDAMAIIQEKIEYNGKKYPAKKLRENPDAYYAIKESYRKVL